ncbi:MAG: tryptophan-rich sensory protein [Flavobacteriaceae bacterium]|nr:tryptophan-rich sensory protein [Flavobacteriaceae bacterium]
MKFFIYLLCFLAINLGGLYLGNILMANEATSQWYLNLNRAPWTPPGWVFGLAWTSIMLCFSVYLSFLFQWKSTIGLWLLLGIQTFLNIIWNYVFFNQHMTLLGLIIIISLFIVILYYFTNFKSDSLKTKRLLLVPYIIWLCIAISLNLYVVIHN